MIRVRAVSLHQPFASAMALGLKGNETRGWATDYRGPLAIHAAKTRKYLTKWDPAAMEAGPWRTAVERFWELGYRNAKDFPLGEIVAVTRLVDCVPVEEFDVSQLPVMEVGFGNYGQGRFVWRTEGLMKLYAPIRERGRQRFWDWYCEGGVEIFLGPEPYKGRKKRKAIARQLPLFNL